VDGAFEPEGHGWTRVNYSGPYILIAMGLPIGVLTTLLLWLGWRETTPASFQFSLPIPLIWAPVVAIFAVFSGMLLVVFIHELLHCAGHPMMGLSPSSYIGAWPTRLLFYAVYLGGIGRNRYLVMAVLPFFVISVVPLALCLVLGSSAAPIAWPLAAASMFNGFSSCGDFIIAPIIWSQVPKNAVVRDNGWHTYWKIIEERVTLESMDASARARGEMAEPVAPADGGRVPGSS
jgi:hypothetical protein